jgi:hypothetical protein
MLAARLQCEKISYQNNLHDDSSAGILKTEEEKSQRNAS